MGNGPGSQVGAEIRLHEDTKADRLDQEVIKPKVRRKLPTEADRRKKHHSPAIYSLLTFVADLPVVWWIRRAPTLGGVAFSTVLIVCRG